MRNGVKLDALFTELCVPWWVESEGKKRVVPKAKLKKDLGVKSHNLADAVIAADNVSIRPKSSFRWGMDGKDYED